MLQKLSEAGVSSVEALADMTPEELEAIPGIDPETIEKISVAVNNYFSRLESAEPAEEALSADAVDVEYPSDPLLAAEAELEPEAAAAEASAEGKPDEAGEGAEVSGEAAGE